MPIPKDGAPGAGWKGVAWNGLKRFSKGCFRRSAWVSGVRFVDPVHRQRRSRYKGP
ncbi:hypothetical protein [Azospirillum palustre]